MQQQNSALPAMLAVFAMIFTQLIRTPGMGHAIHEFVALLRSLMAMVAVGVGGYMMLQMAQEEPPQMIAASTPPPSLPAPTAAPPQINSIEDVPISVITKAIAEYKSTQAAKVQESDAKVEITQ
jgi:hypothetical protein